MIPAARDPRMDRDPGPPTPRGTPGWVWGALAGLALVLVAVLPRARAYGPVVSENVALKEELLGIERRMDEVDRILGRLRLYDAQLRSLTEAQGDHGPLPELEALSGAGVLEYYQDLEAESHEVGGPLLRAPMVDGPLAEGPLPPDALRPADQWADEVADRVDDFVELFALSEPELAALMADLETLDAIARALPSFWPAEGRFTSGFGWRRDPLRRYTKFHAGIDIANSTGTRVHAAADGTVIKSRYTSGYGNTIEIDHGFGVVTRYAHLSRRRVRAGDHVERGEYVGTMGSTGRSTGPHLHFELLIDGSAHDPMKYLPR